MTDPARHIGSLDPIAYCLERTAEYLADRDADYVADYPAVCVKCGDAFLIPTWLVLGDTPTLVECPVCGEDTKQMLRRVDPFGPWMP